MMHKIAGVLKRNWIFLLVSSLIITFMLFFSDEFFGLTTGPLLPPVWESGFLVVGTVSL